MKLKYKKILTIILSIALISSLSLAAPLVIKDSSCGIDFQLYLTGEGRLYGIGKNSQGELGLGDAKTEYDELEEITDEANADDRVLIPEFGQRTVTSGADFTVIIKKDKKAYATGENYFGQLANGSDVGSKVFIEMLAEDGVVNENIKSVSAGADFVLLLNEDGEVLGAGDNTFKQLNQNGLAIYNKLTKVYSNPDKKAISIATGSRHSLILLEDGTVMTLGDNRHSQRNISVPTGKKVVEIAAGGYHSLVKLDDGYVWGVGNNESQQLEKHVGQETVDKVKSELVPILDESGSKLKAPTGVDKIRTISAGFDFSLAIKAKDGKEAVIGVGGKDNNQLGREAKTKNENSVKLQTIDTVENLTAGWQHTVIMGKDKNNEKTESKGNKFYGSVELGKTLEGEESKTVAMGAGHTLYVKDDVLYGAGNNTYGQLGVSTYSSSVRKIPFNVKALGGVKQIATGAAHSVLLGFDGSIWVTGYNYSGQLGLGDNNDRFAFTKLNYAFDSLPTAIAAGGDVTLILTQEGNVYAMGDNVFKQLMDSDITSYNTPTKIIDGEKITQISAGIRYTLALKAEGTLIARGENASQFEGQANNIKKIASGAYHSLLLLADGSVKAIGRNTNGQLGNGSVATTNSVVVSDITIADAKIRDIAVGYKHSLFLTDKGVYVCGSVNGEENKLTPEKVNIATPKEIATGWLGNIVKTAGAVLTIGNNQYGQRGTYRGQESAEYDDSIYDFSKKKVAAGDGFTLVLHSDGTLWGIGNNTYGQLGIGDNVSRTKFVKINTPVEVGNIADIEAGADFTLILTRDGEVYGTGKNTYGLFGDNTVASVNKFVKLDINNVRKIYAGVAYQGIIVLKNDDTLWSVGTFLIKDYNSIQGTFTTFPVELARDEYIKNALVAGPFVGVEVSDGSNTREIVLADEMYGIESIGGAYYAGRWTVDLHNNNGLKKMYISTTDGGFEVTGDTALQGYVHMITTEGTNELLDTSNTTKIIGREFTESIVDFAVGQNHMVVITEFGQLYAAGDNTITVDGKTEYGLLSNEFLTNNSIEWSRVFVPMYIQNISTTTGVVVN